MVQKGRQISIHAPAKERHMCNLYAGPLCDFNPRSCEGATGHINNSQFFPFYFNPRSCEGATISEVMACRTSQNFNPRSCEGATSFITNFLSPTYNLLSHFAQIIFLGCFKLISINAHLTRFVTFFGCESPVIFMYTFDSHRTRTT